MARPNLPSPDAGKPPPSLAERVAGPLLVFAVIAAILVAAHGPAIRSATWENGDMAANSLLVQDAKSFHLLIGNYSRLGFNHPGPALLYVLAAGEAVFYDWLKLTPYPMGGQMLGVIVYAAAWTALLWTMLRRAAGSAPAAALLLAVFLAATSLLVPEAFVWLWPPDLYYFPFVVFMLALRELIAGKNNSLPALAVSWGFLLNGHASFFAITALMLLLAVAANLALFLYAENPPVSLLSPAFLRRSRARLGCALLILLLFLVPLALETALHFPGPLADYLTYGRGQAWNNPVAGLLFVSMYWGGFAGFLLGMAILARLWLLGRGRAGELTMLSLGASILAATIAVLFYAVFGVDDIHASYIGIFYYGAPALTAVLVVQVLWNRFSWGNGAKTTFIAFPLVTLGCLGLVYDRVAAVPGNDCRAEIPELFARMETLGRMPLVLDLDSSNAEGNDWGHVWATLAGVENYAKRQGVRAFVIRKNWQILFTRQARYAGPRIPAGDWFFVSCVDRPGAALRFLGLSFYPLGAFSLSAGQSFRMASDKEDFVEYFLESGWSFPERDFVWSGGPEVHLLLPFRSREKQVISLDLGAFLPDPDATQHIEVTADGVPVGDASFSARHDPHNPGDRGDRWFTLPAGLREPVDLKITIDHPSSPHDANYFSRDMRRLGVSLYGLGVAREPAK